MDILDLERTVKPEWWIRQMADCDWIAGQYLYTLLSENRFHALYGYKSRVLALADGKVLHTVSADYPHGVLDVCLPSGKPLPKGFALQHPGDYLFALYETVPVLIRESGVRPEEIAGIGIDFTSSTLLPLREDGMNSGRRSTPGRSSGNTIPRRLTPGRSKRSPRPAAKPSSAATAGGSPPSGFCRRSWKLSGKRPRSTTGPSSRRGWIIWSGS